MSGLKTPYEQWVASFGLVAFFFKGIPSIRRAFWCYKFEAATTSGDTNAVAEYASKLKLSELAKVEIPSMLSKMKTSGGRWAGVAVFGTMYAWFKRTDAVRAIYGKSK